MSCGHIHIKQLEAFCTVVSVCRAVPAEDNVYGSLHLPYVQFSAGAQRFLDVGLVGTGTTPERTLECFITPDARVDLRKTVRPGEDGDEGILQLLRGRMPQALLKDDHLLLDRLEQF
jgi:hypothetical protein